MITIALDVATRYTGYGMFRYDLNGSKASLIQYGNLRGGSGDIRERCSTIATKVYALRAGLEDKYERMSINMVLEYPTFYSGTRGHSASIHGDTIKLGFMCGVIQGVFMTVCGVVLYYYTYPQWNGQLPKKVTAKRFFEKFGIYANPNSIENNFVDACMMGVYHITKTYPAIKSFIVEGTREDL